MKIIATVLLAAGGWLGANHMLATANVRVAASATRHQANPMGLFFNNTFGNVELYQRAGAMLIAGNCNRYDPQFEAARAAGAEVLAYFNPIEVYNQIPCKLNKGFYMDGRVPLWPFPEPGVRVNWPKSRMVDLRVGSTWMNYCVAYIENLMREGKVDGVFLDNVGARLWARAGWDNWPKAEQDAWTDGEIELVRRIDASRRRINPNFIVITNNIWDRGDPRGFAGEKYVDGVVLEHPTLSSYHTKYAGREFSDLGHRRMVVIARNDEEAMEWSHVPGVTHVASQHDYSHPGPPLVPFTALTDRPKLPR